MVFVWRPSCWSVAILPMPKLLFTTSPMPTDSLYFPTTAFSSHPGRLTCT